MAKRKNIKKKVKNSQKENKIKINWKTLIVCLIIVYVVAGLGTLIIGNETSSNWYDAIKPAITPPNFVFPIVWSVLFLLMGLSLYYCWISDRREKKKVILVFGVNFVLNLFWSYFYFMMHDPRTAFVDIVLLFVSILSMIYVSWKISKKASWLLLPYGLWVIFAGVLNYLSIK